MREMLLQKHINIIGSIDIQGFLGSQLNHEIRKQLLRIRIHKIGVHQDLDRKVHTIIVDEHARASTIAAPRKILTGTSKAIIFTVCTN